jgi:photosystem II stability/assembly factor-like uncharacterized protein
VLQQTSSVSPGAAFVGPDVHSILIDPRSPSHIFVGGHASAVVSTDGGRTLQQVNGLQNVDAMNWLSSSDGKEQFVAGHYGVRLSRDNGSSWGDLTANLPKADVHAAGMDPATPTHLWAYVVGMGVYASVDAGSSWSLAGGQTLFLMGPIIVTAGGKDLLATDMQAGVVRSRDGGRTWSPTAPDVLAFWMTVDPADPNHLLAVGRLLYETKDGGSSWAPAATLPDGVRAVAIAPGATSTWFAGRWANQDASVLVSTDHGQHWQAVAPGS